MVSIELEYRQTHPSMFLEGYFFKKNDDEKAQRTSKIIVSQGMKKLHEQGEDLVKPKKQRKGAVPFWRKIFNCVSSSYDRTVVKKSKIIFNIFFPLSIPLTENTGQMSNGRWFARH